MAQSTVMFPPKKILLPGPFPFSFLPSLLPSLSLPLSPFPLCFPFPLSLSPFPISPFSFPRSLSHSLPPLPFSFPFPCIFLLFSLLLSLSLYKWNAVVTYRWRNPQLWFPEKKFSSLSLSLSPVPFSFPFPLPCPFSPFLSLCPFLLFLSLSPLSFPFPPCIDGVTLKHIGNTFRHRWRDPQK